MKKLSIVLAVLYTAALTGCLKDTPNTDFSQTFPTVEIMYSGMQFFSASSPQGQSYAMSFKQSTLTYDLIVNLNSTYPLNKDISVTLAIDDAARVAYNSANGTDYQAMPAAIYNFPVTQGTIKSGTRQVHFSLTFDSAKFKDMTDPAISYMVPITLKDASGVVIASNFQTIYPHTIGNALAGDYNWDFSRWDGADSTTGKFRTDLSFTGDVTSFIPDNPTQVEVQAGYYIGPRYVITFSNNGGVLSNFAVKLNQTDVNKMADGGVTVAVAPQIITADPVKGIYKFVWTASTGSGPRYVVDTYYK